MPDICKNPLLKGRKKRVYIIDQYNIESGEKILVTMTPTSGYTVGFNLTFTGSVYIDFKDGGGKEALTSGVEKTNTYTTGGTYIAEITGDLENITAFNADNNRITAVVGLKTGLLIRLDLQNNLLTGTLDMSDAPISSVLLVNGNSGLTGFTFSSSGNGKLTAFYFYSCNITGSIDLATPGITVGGDIRGYSNSGFTGILFAATGNTILTNWRMYGCAIVSQDFTNVPVSGILWFHDNTVTTTLIFASSGNGSLTQFYANDNDLPDVDFTIFTGGTATIRMQNNNLTATEHDNQLINLDSSGLLNGILTIITGNTARTSASDTAYNNLIANGWTIN